MDAHCPFRQSCILPWTWGMLAGTADTPLGRARPQLQASVSQTAATVPAGPPKRWRCRVLTHRAGHRRMRIYCTALRRWGHCWLSAPHLVSFWRTACSSGGLL